MKDGIVVATPNAPVISDRPGLLRVYVAPAFGTPVRSVTAELHADAGGNARSFAPQTLEVRVTSDDARPGSAFDFALAAADVPPGAAISVTLRDASGASMRFPSDGSTLDLHALDAMRVKLEVVPMKYDADGSGRVSDTSDAAMKTLHDAIFGTYPVSSVEITVRAQPLLLTTAIDAQGTGWDDAMAALVGTRATDGVSDDTYLVGLVDPAASVADYCPSGCVTALASSPPATAVAARAMVMLGFPQMVKSQSASSLGLAMGRTHAPCGSPARPDPAFPYAGALSPDPGYDVVAATLVPSGYADIMSFCQPAWVTDYTFAGLAQRIAFVSRR